MARKAEHHSVRDRIARAHQKKESSQKQTLRHLARLALVIGVIGSGVWLGSLLFQDETEPTYVPAQVPKKPESPQAGSEAAPPAPSTQAAPQPAPPKEPAKPRANPETVSAAKDKVAELVKEYTEANQKMPGAPAALERISQHQLRAEEAADEGDLDAALQLLTTALHEGEALRTAAEDRFKANIGAAAAALQKEDVNTARAHAEQALQQRPESKDAKQLEARIGRFLALRAARHAAEDARIAGRPQAERAALEKVLKVTPGDAAAKARIAEIGRLEEERQFGRFIAQGRQAVADRDAALARAALGAAEKLRPKHADTAVLRKELAEFQRILSRDKHLADGAQAANRDDWEAAHREFDAARVLDPAHGGAIMGGDLAARIMDSRRAIGNYLARPARLATPEIAAAARNTLEEASDLLELSPTLKSMASELEEEVGLQQTPVVVIVLSDGETDIGIRGMGRIGRTERREIQLRPGVYAFEGRRRGYRTKLVQIRVVAGSGPIELQIVCDEQT